jgi:hypothetical protein
MAVIRAQIQSETEARMKAEAKTLEAVKAKLEAETKAKQEAE